MHQSIIGGFSSSPFLRQRQDIKPVSRQWRGPPEAGRAAAAQGDGLSCAVVGVAGGGRWCVRSAAAAAAAEVGVVVMVPAGRWLAEGCGCWGLPPSCISNPPPPWRWSAEGPAGGGSTLSEPGGGAAVVGGVAPSSEDEGEEVLV